MLVVTRFQVPEVESHGFRVSLEEALAALAEQSGFRSGTVGRNVDDPTLWALVTSWENAGAYRRALSSYDVKIRAVATLGRALDEPSAYEVVEPGTEINIVSTRSIP